MLKMKLALMSAFVLVGCSTPMKNFKAVRGEDGLFRLVGKDETEPDHPQQSVIRHKDGKLVTTAEAAEAEIKSADRILGYLDTHPLLSCDGDEAYLAKVAQFKALESARKGNLNEALKGLDEAEKACAKISQISGQSYFRAAILQKKGETSLAQESVQKFLNESAAIEPAIFAQSDKIDFWGREEKDSMQIEAKRFIEYRSRAEAFVSGRSSTLELEPVTPFSRMEAGPRLPPQSAYVPGGNTAKNLFIFPHFIYSSHLGSEIGAYVLYQWGEYSVGVLAAPGGGELGGTYGLRLRKSLYESPTRDWNVETYISAVTLKEFRVTENKNFGYPSYTVQKVGEAVRPGIGIGATKRFDPRWAATGELAAYQSVDGRSIRTLSSLYGSYTYGLTYFAGAVQNKPVIGFDILWVKLGADFSQAQPSLFFATQGINF